MTTSSLCRAFLLAETTSKPYNANALFDTLRAKHPEARITTGAVSGWLSRAAAFGAMTVSNVDGLYTYVVTDKRKLAAMTVRDGTYAGGTEGRRRKGPSPAHIPSLGSIQSRLLDLAAELELARTPLAQFTTEELLTELGRRTRAAA